MPETRNAPTLHDVARAAGVSTATVSRCLNAPDRVIESTRDRVMEAVQRLGYMPHFGARVMAARRTWTIGAIIPTMENAIFARGLQAFQETLREAGYTLLVASSSYSLQEEAEQIRTLVARGADGLLLIGQDRADAARQFLNGQQVPVLTAWTHGAAGGLPSVGFDNRQSMRTLAEAVIAQGHSRIGMISAETATNDRARQRVEGIRDAAHAACLPDDALRVIETRYGFETGAEALRSLMAADPVPTVVMCGNDVLAVGAMRAARELGLSVPEDLSITGFDDIEIATVVVPALTTVHVPHREMGRRAAAALVAMVEGRPLADTGPLTAHLEMRDSLGPPRNAG